MTVIDHRDLARVFGLTFTPEQQEVINVDLVPDAVADLERFLHRPIEPRTIVGETHTLLRRDEEVRLRETPVISIEAVRVDDVVLTTDQYFVRNAVLKSCTVWGGLSLVSPDVVSIDYTAGFESTRRGYRSLRRVLLTRVFRDYRRRPDVDAQPLTMPGTNIPLPSDVRVRRLAVEGYDIELESLSAAVNATGFTDDEESVLRSMRRRVMRG